MEGRPQTQLLGGDEKICPGNTGIKVLLLMVARMSLILLSYLHPNIDVFMMAYPLIKVKYNIFSKGHSHEN